MTVTNRLSDHEVKSFWKERLFDISRTPFLPERTPQKNLAEAWRWRVGKSSEKRALHFLGHDYTFQDLDRMSDEVAASLLRRPFLKKGSRIAIMMPNSSQYLVTLLGILKAGMIVVNCNPLYTKEEIAHQLKDSGASLLFTVENVAKAPADAISEGLCPELKEFSICEIGDLLPFARRLLVNSVIRHVKKMIPPYQKPQNVKVTSLRSFLRPIQNSDRRLLEAAEKNILPSDLAFIQYTGGTTGRAKGAMLSHENILFNMLQAEASLPPHLKTEIVARLEKKGFNNALCLIPLPFYHIYSLTCGVLTLMITYGSSLSTLPNPRDLKALIKLMNHPDLILCALINTLVKGLLNSPHLGELKMPDDTVIISGGMATEPEVAVKWEKLTRSRVLEGYGMTESSPLLTLGKLETSAPGRAGYPVPGLLLKLRDAEGGDLPLGRGPGVRGELLVKGPQVMRGYYNNKAETDLIMTDDGYLATGDIATISEDGMIDLVDRKKDMILVSGFNVYPSEIEEKALATGLPLEAAAISAPDDKTGEKVVLYLVRKPTDLALDQKAFIGKMALSLNESLTNYKRPAEIIVIDALPKSPVGKILKKDLRALYLEKNKAGQKTIGG